MWHLTTRYVLRNAVKQFDPCADITECAYTNLAGTAYYTPRLYDIAYYCRIQACKACYKTTGD